MSQPKTNPHHGYMWQPQPYVSWKGAGNTLRAAVPAASRPQINGRNISASPPRPAGPAFRARPIKHWRNQLQPVAHSGGRRQMYNSWAPGSSIKLTGKLTCCGREGGGALANTYVGSVQTGASVAGRRGSRVAVPDLWDGSKVLTPNGVRCTSCSPPNIRIRSGIVQRKSNYSRAIANGPVVMTSRYYPNAGSYLYARYRTYQQNLVGPVEDASGAPPLSSVPEGPRFARYRAINAGKGIACSCPRVVPQYKNQRPQRPVGVSASERLLRLKLNTIQKAASSTSRPFGRANATALSYRPTASDLLSTKSFYQPCVPIRVFQNKNLACPPRQAPRAIIKTA